MEVRQVESVDRVFLSGLKMNGGRLFGPQELDFLLENGGCRVYDFVQETENETDADFYHRFVAWLHEDPHKGYVYYYLICGMRKGEFLSDDEMVFLERNVTECFDTGYGWLAQMNRELRFKRRVRLILFEKENGFSRLIAR